MGKKLGKFGPYGMMVQGYVPELLMLVWKESNYQQRNTIMELIDQLFATFPKEAGDKLPSKQREQIKRDKEERKQKEEEQRKQKEEEDDRVRQELMDAQFIRNVTKQKEQKNDYSNEI